MMMLPPFAVQMALGLSISTISKSGRTHCPRFHFHIILRNDGLPNPKTLRRQVSQSCYNNVDDVDDSTRFSAVDPHEPSKAELEIMQLAQSHFSAQALLAAIRVGAFDVLEVKGTECTWEVEEKFKNLSEWLKGKKEVFAIEQNKFESRKDIIAFFKSADENNAEGLVVKLPNGTAYKVKKVHHLDLVVLGYAESNGEQAGVLRELLLGCALDNNQFQIITKCGSGFSEKERTELVKQLEPLSVSSEYTEVSGAKTAFIFVKPEVVVEISCLDLINENSNGPIKKALLNFDKSTYTVVGNASTLSVISPNFTRLREDKKANEKESGTLQAYALCEPITAGASAETGVASQIVMREVFTKSGKGGTAVRKFVALKTNKEKSGAYSPFVVVYSDFSAGRKTPLEQEIFLCENEKEAAAKITALKEENIKKGWEQFN